MIVTICSLLGASLWMFFFFFFQAEDGIRDGHVTEVQTCALPISFLVALPRQRLRSEPRSFGVRPAHEHSASGVGKRPASPISATNTAARTRPTPFKPWMAR